MTLLLARKSAEAVLYVNKHLFIRKVVESTSYPQQRSGHVATWVARIPPPYLDAPDADVTDESLIDELEEMTAEGDFAEDELFGMDELVEEDGGDSENGDDGYELSQEDGAEVDDDDDELLEEGESDNEDGDELLEDEESTLTPVRVRGLTCSRRGRICKATLVS